MFLALYSYLKYLPQPIILRVQIDTLRHKDDVAHAKTIRWSHVQVADKTYLIQLLG